MKKPPSFRGFEQPLICTKCRFAVPFFLDQRLTRKYYSIITGMLNQQSAIVKVLGRVFTSEEGLEALRVMPFVQLRILNPLGMSRRWNCVFRVVCVCAGLTHTRVQNYACTHRKTHTHWWCLPSPPRSQTPPRLFSLVIMSKFAQEGRGKGEPCELVWAFFIFSYKKKPASDNRRSPRSKITF